jgi:hypothetical protein
MSPASAGRNVVGVVAIVLAYLAGLNLAWQPVQIRVWNYFNWIDILVMLALVAPFLATRWVWPSSIRATRIAWWLAAIMALDVLVFTIMTVGPGGGGHPSLESLALYFSAMAKIAMVPAALIALCIAFSNGERVIAIALGIICLVAESVYSVPGPVHPFRWLLVRYWLTGDVS